jgi:site-specific DNA-methyltransferase (adenine-specific)
MLDILTYKRVPRGQRVYSAEKPIDLMRALVESCTLPGDYVLDPCAGSGSTLVACRDARRKALGFEIDSNIVDLAETRLAKTEAEYETLVDTLIPEGDTTDA